MSTNGNEQAPQPQTIETSISFDLEKGIVVVTPKSLNGIALVNAVACPVPVDNWLQVAAMIILGQLKMKAAAMRTDAHGLMKGLSDQIRNPRA